MFQDGRPLKYDSGDFPASLGQAQGARRLGRLRRRTAGRPQAAGRRVGLGIGCYVEGTGVGPYEGGHVHVETSGRVNVATGLTTQGQGHQTILAQIVADELGVRIEDVHVTTGDTRRMPYAVGTFASRGAVMSGNAVALAAQVVRAKALRIAADALEVSPDDLQIDDGVISVKGTPDAAAHRPVDRRGAVEPPALRLRRVGAGRHPVRRDLRPRQAPGGRRRRAGPRGPGLLLPHPGHLRQRHARGDRRDRPGHRRDPHPALLRRPRLRRHGQPDDRRGAGPRRRGAGRRRGALRADGLRRVRASCSTPRSWTSSSPTPPRSRTSRPTTSRPRARSTRSASREPARPGTIPVTRRHRLGDRGRRGLPHPLDADQPGRALGAAPAARRRRPTPDHRPVPAQEGSR